MSNNVGALNVELTAAIGRFTEAMDAAQRKAESAFAGMNKAASVAKTALGFLGVGLSVAGFVSSVQSAIDKLDGLYDLSLRTGASVEALSALSGVAKLSGTEMETLAGGIQKLSRAMAGSEEEGQKAGEVFKRLGIDVADSATGQLRPAEEVLVDVAKKLNAMESSTQRVAFAQQIFGKSGAQLLPFLKELAETGKLNAKVTTEQAEAADKFNDNLTKIKSSINAAKIAIANELLPTLNDITDAFLRGRTEGGLYRGAIDGLKEAFIALFSTGLEQQARQNLQKIVELEERVNAFERLPSVNYRKKQLAEAQKQLNAALAEELRIQGLLDIQRSGGIADGAPKPTPTVVGAADTKEKKAVEDGKAFLEQLQRRLVKTTENEYASLRLEAAQKKVSAAAEPLIVQIERETRALEEMKRVDEEIARSNSAEVQRRLGLVNGVAAYVKSLEEEVSLMRLSNEQRLVAIQLLRLEEAGLQRGSVEFEAAAERVRNAVQRNAGGKLFEETRTPIETLNRELARLQELLDSGAIDWDTYARGVFRAQDSFDRTRESVKELEDAGKELQIAFTSAFEDAIVKGGELGRIVRGLEQDILRILTRKLVTEPLAKAVGDFLPAGGFGDLFGKFRELIGFREGGSFMVGGGGGPDSRLVAFRASPDERVTVQTPAQQRAAAVGGWSRSVTININGQGMGGDNRSREQIAAAVAIGLRRAERRFA